MAKKKTEVESDSSSSSEEVEEVEEEEDDDGEGESSKRESICKLLEPFGKDQLIDLLKEAARNNPIVLQRIIAAAESDTTHRKIFVHGLGWDVTTDTVRAAFLQYGEIEECKVVTDRTTGRSKGYGFVLFRTRAGAQKVLQQPQKKIGNRMAACQLASAGPVQSAGGAGAIAKNAPAMGTAMLQPNDLALTHASTSLMGLNPVAAGLVGQNVFPGAAGMVGQSMFPGTVGIVGQSAGAGGLNSTLAATGLPSSANWSGTTPPPYGLGLGFGGATPGINSISPGVIGSYGSQAALQGLGAYQSSQLSSTTGMSSQSGPGSVGANLPHYLGG